MRERARRGARARAGRHPFELEEVDIGGDAALEGTYREWLPVVEIDGPRAFVYYVDESRVQAEAAR